MYQPISDYQSAAALLEQPVQVEGKMSFMVMQHMMAGGMKMMPDGSFERARDFAFDADGLGQIIVYYYKGQMPEGLPQSQRLRVYGTLREVSGPGKGGNGQHREYYINLDKVDVL